MNIDLLREVEKGQEDWAFSIGVQAYIWGFPIVECWKDRLNKSWRDSDNKDGPSDSLSTVNAFRHVRSLSTHDSSEFVNSASDFLYSTAVIDLSSGPLILNAPNFGTRWYGIQVLDAYMETLANYGTRTNGNQMPAVILANVAQRREISVDANVVESETDYVYIVVRVSASPHESLSECHSLQDKIILQELMERVTPFDKDLYASNQQFVSSNSNCPDSLKFFQELASVIQYVPPKADEAHLLALFQEIGLSVEHGFNYNSIPSGIKNGLAKAVPFAQSILERKIFEVGTNINGWGVVTDIGNYDKNYIVRALVAKHGIWANVPEESVYFIARTDDQGQILHGNHRYEITFPAGSLPPVNAFWSISYYDEKGCIRKESKGKNSINSLHNNLYFEADGSTTIFISKDKPEEHLQDNWLPSHGGFFSLNLRCYNPKQTIIDLTYSVPNIQVKTRSLEKFYEKKIAVGE